MKNIKTIICLSIALLLIFSMLLLSSCAGKTVRLIDGADDEETVTTDKSGTDGGNDTSGSDGKTEPSVTTDQTAGNGAAGTADPDDTAAEPTTADKDDTEPTTDEPAAPEVSGSTSGTVTATEPATAIEPETEAPQTESGVGTTISSSYGGKTYTLTITAESGSYSVKESDGELTIGFTADTEITLAGSYAGSIRISGSEDADIIVNLSGCTVLNYTDNPAFYVESAANCDISAKSGSVNYIYDNGDAREELSSAIYSTCDLKLKGSGELTVTSENNNGVHSKDDLTTQKLTLTVNCVDNALKGNDSVTVKSGIYTLIARQGDGIKTSSTDLSSKGVQRGTVMISGGIINIYAACDGIDAAYDVVINDDESKPVISIFTDKYSEYSEEVTAVTDGTYYIRNTSTGYKYSIYYYNTDGSYKWVNSSGYTTVNAGMSRYYYYEVAKESGYTNMILYIYTSSQAQGQSDDYYRASGGMALNNSYDTIAITTRSNTMSLSWTNYTTSQNPGGGWGGPGGMSQGNSDKGDYSTKGIKAGNAIVISSGTINIKSYDDAIHANTDSTFESGAAPKGSVTISGGVITVYSNDDGVHADGTLTVSGGTLTVTNSYEGLEGNEIDISGGKTYVTASDDGVNASSGSSNPKIVISGGYLDVTVSPNGDTDGIDSNGTYTQTGGVVITRGPSSQQSAALDADGSKTISGGTLIILGYGSVSTSGGVKSCSLSLHSSGSHTVTIDGVSYTFTNTASYGRTYCYSSATVTG